MQRGRVKKRPADEGEAANESQQMRALGSHLKQPKGSEKEIQQFQTKVAADKRGLEALLQQRSQQVKQDDARRRNEISTLIVDALSKPNATTQRVSATFPMTQISNNTIFKSAVKVDEASRNMVSEYETLQSVIETMKNNSANDVTEKWMQGAKETERLLKLGHKTAARNVKRVLGDAEASEEDGEEEGGFGLKQRQLNMELCDGLRYAERGVKRMTKGLPRDEH